MKSKLIRIAPILLIIAIAILAITAIVSIGRMMLGGGSNQPAQKTEEQEASIVELLKNEVGRSVKMTVRGPIVANEDARSYTVEISNSQRSLKTYKGYTAEVIDDVKLDNNSAAYDELVYALNKANMMKGVALTGEADDLRGICASGHTYDFAILKNGEVVKHLWTSTCAGSKGSLDANVEQLQNLFISQIPNNSQIVRDLGISKKSNTNSLFGN
jgi:hypothetical protein